MRRMLAQVVSCAALALVASAVAPACATNDQSIFLRGVLAPPTNRQNGICVYSDDPTQTQLFSGLLDVALRDNYEARMLVGSQLIARGDPAQTRAESNRFHVNGAVVRVTTPNGEPINEFSTPVSGFIDPQSNNVPDFGPVSVVLIDAGTVRKLSPNGQLITSVVANVKMFGQTLGGVDVESGELQYPIDICAGCLVDFSSGDDPARAGRDCSLPLEDSSTQTGPCTFGQDEGVPCQYCVNTIPACGTSG